ncbi:MAG: 50S ribosomal protein L29 [Oscillospiraceae bacterium]|nr:50S ribosomal protein L29 [Oscillospiraceae bacterium]
MSKNTKEIKNLSDVELNDQLKDLSKSLFNLRFQNTINQLENPVRIREVRREIARIKTEQRKRELAAE